MMCVASEARADEPPAAPAEPLPAAAPAEPPAAAAPAEPPAAAATPVAPTPDPSKLQPTVAWNPAWPKFKLGEYLVMAGLGAGIGAFILFGNVEAEPNWRGPILFDETMRNAVRATSASGRETAQFAGNLFYYGGLAYPYLVEVLAVTAVGHRATEVAGQMALINTEAFAIAGFLSFVSNATIRRERPYNRECGPGKDPGFPGCEKAGLGEGFFSGHTAIAFTGAALTCSHSAKLPLYGKSGVGGTIACVASMAGATAGGFLRLPADKHYASDIIVGAAIGLASGFLVPYFHYRGASPTSTTASSSKPPGIRWLPAPMLSATTAGVGAFGTF